MNGPVAATASTPVTPPGASLARPGASLAPPLPQSPWFPVSPCTPRCARPAAPPVSPLHTARRYAAFGQVVAGALASPSATRDGLAVRERARALLAALGVRLDVGDTPLAVPGTGALVVADHISWLDIVALLACEPVTLVAKREVGRWPVVGPLARRVDTCFIDRGSLRALPRAVDRVRESLAAGRTVAVFPQGTTWCSAAGGGFRRAMFQAAIDARVPVRPATLSYLQHGRPSTVAGFLGDEGFVPSLHRVAQADGLAVRVRAHPPLPAGPGTGAGEDRRTLAAAAQESVFRDQPRRHG
ncbi:lysophospholipid acyltransferase family protein [Streptomyces cavernicola]|uniref:1-acyl-sn-glycerol-3-phosphate acyltransferase n=1 Tax=Streptomyces cavernicola TaxID=3043613 RepID=A0ABT6S9E5_9ACTN|nr:1-acyl-sn-glycerol-3-phosphate acyltransferase [Streptomyces sp. B-S-A6]MDI3404655.1 1-acyl-sn-glycerol-3-phosphate acyltransferase [Streptomyces sp. B-S-A6]